MFMFKFFLHTPKVLQFMSKQSGSIAVLNFICQCASSPMSSLFLTSSAMFLRAVATEHTTLSLSIRSSSTRMGSPFSFRTAARMYAANCPHKNTQGCIQPSDGSTRGGICLDANVQRRWSFYIPANILSKWFVLTHLSIWKQKRMCTLVCVCLDTKAYLPVTGWQVLEGTSGALQSGRIWALSQQCQVRLNHWRVPQHLCSFGRLGEARDWPHTIPLINKQQVRCW